MEDGLSSDPTDIGRQWRGHQPGNDSSCHLSEALSVSAEWLASGRGEMAQAAPAKVRASEGERVEIGSLPPNQRKAIEALLRLPQFALR